MKSNDDFSTLAATFIKELPAEYIEDIINDGVDCSFKFLDYVPVPRRGDAYIIRLREIENVSIKILNRYYTSLLQEELKKIIKKK